MRMRKGLAVLLALVLVAVAVAGCAKKAEEPAPAAPAPSEPAPTPAPEPAPKPVELQYWEQDEPAIDPTIDELIAQFQNENPGITVVRTHYSTEDLRSNFQTAALGGEGPHIVYGPDDNIGVFATAGIITPLDGAFPADFINSLEPKFLDGNRYNGQLWGIPDRVGNQLTLLYNKSLVPSAPATWDELITVAKGLTSGDTFGLAYNLNEPFWLIPFYGGFGGSVMDGQNNPTLNNTSLVNTFQFVKDLKFAHKIVPQECDYSCADSLFKDGKAAMIINGPWSFADYQAALGDNLGLAVIPQFPGGTYGAPFTSSKTYHITKLGGDDPDIKAAAVKFIMFMNTKEAQLKLVPGHKQFPTNQAAAADPSVANDPVIKATVAQVANGTPMPIVPEMRAIWDSIRPQQEQIMAGAADPAAAAAAAQTEAENQVKAIRGQ